jgi:hypothetical protein
MNTALLIVKLATLSVIVAFFSQTPAIEGLKKLIALIFG